MWYILDLSCNCWDCKVNICIDLGLDLTHENATRLLGSDNFYQSVQSATNQNNKICPVEQPRTTHISTCLQLHFSILYKAICLVCISAMPNGINVFQWRVIGFHGPC